MKTLDEIALETGTDKNSLGHGYTHVYDLLFEPWRDCIITLVEIGVWEGASLRMWREYFTNPDARIIGVDNDMSRAPAEILGCELLTANAVTEALKVAEWAGVADIVVDDGSHIAADQAITFAMLWPRMRPGGLYCIEDLHTYWWDANPDGADGWLIELIRDVWGRGDTRTDKERKHPTDIGAVMAFQSLVVIEKKNDP